MRPRLSVRIGKLKLQNPVMVASGTFGYGEEFKDFIPLRSLGAIVTKTITVRPRRGNAMPRTCETPYGMINSIGLENPGIDGFIRDKMPALKKIGVPIIVSIASEGGFEEFVQLARRLDKIRQVAAIELNISCPNIKVQSTEYGVQRKRPGAATYDLRDQLIAQDPQATYNLVKAVRKVTGKTLITKLSPNVTSIADIAVAAEKAGSDAVCLVNTFTAMSIDIDTKKPKVAAGTGGLSGPAIRPIAVRMVWEVYRQVKIPVIGMGGILDASGALEFIIAGATAISVGTANFINPKASMEIIAGLKKYMVKNNIGALKALTGSLQL